jgi:hypothetical protein
MSMWEEKVVLMMKYKEQSGHIIQYSVVCLSVA